MKKTFLAIALSCTPAIAFAAQTPVTTIDTLREATNKKLRVIETNRQDHVINFVLS